MPRRVGDAVKSIRTAFGLSIFLILSPGAALAATCSIDIHPRFNLYVINVDGKPFKNKHYVDYGDAALLRSVLVEAGRCVPVEKLAKCGSGGSTGRTRVVLLPGATAGPKNTRSGNAQLNWSADACRRP